MHVARYLELACYDTNVYLPFSSKKRLFTFLQNQLENQDTWEANVNTCVNVSAMSF